MSGDLEQALPLLRRPMVVDGENMTADWVEQMAPDWLTVVIHQGKNRQVRRMCAAVGLSVLRLKRVRDFAQVKYDGKITYEVAAFALDLLEVDKMGLDQNDRNIILTIIDKFDGGPVGLDTLAASLGEDSGTIEDVYEPYLVKNDFINRTPKGRVATAFAYEHFGRTPKSE